MTIAGWIMFGFFAFIFISASTVVYNVFNNKTHGKIVSDESTSQQQSGLKNIPNLPLPILLDQLSEECAELIQAAHKVKRTLNTDNPTPISPEQANANLIEEIADVLLCIEALSPDKDTVWSIMDKKEKRWAQRHRKNQ